MNKLLNIISSVKKKRITFTYNKQFCKLDLFEDGLILLEVGVDYDKEKVSIPNDFMILRDVTDNDEYKNINFGIISSKNIKRKKL